MKEPNCEEIGEKTMNNEMREGRKRKSIIIVILALLATVIAAGIGVTIYNTPSNRLSRQLDLGEKYLEEQNYEQAIVEFDKAIAIDPMNERAYIGKAEAYVGMGDYEQAAVTYAAAVQAIPDGNEVWSAAEKFYLEYAQIYIDNGDYVKAISILEEGYDLLGSEKLHNKIGELEEEAEQKEEEERRASGIVKLPFNLRDITVRGYDLFEDHFAEMRGLYPTGEGWEVTNTNDFVFQEPAADGSYSYYINNTTFANSGHGTAQELWVNHAWGYIIYYQPGSTHGTTARLILNRGYDDWKSDYEGLSVPIKPGSSYDDWRDVIQLAQIKERGTQPEWHGSGFCIPGGGEYPDYSYSGSEKDEIWVFMTDEYRVIYSEMRHDYGASCELRFQPPKTYSGERRAMTYNINVNIGTDGIISQITYECFL